MDSLIIPQQRVRRDYDIAVLSTSNVDRDSRILRQLGVVSKLGSVVCIAPGTLSVPGVDHISIKHGGSGNIWSRRYAKAKRIAMLGSGAHESFYWSNPIVRMLKHEISSISSKVVIANDLEPLPVAVRYGGQAAVVFDAHEYYPGQQSDSSFSGRLWNRHSEILCRRYMPAATLVTTVAPGIAKLYNELCGVTCVHVPNCPASTDCVPGALRSDGKIRMVHHGAYRRTRGIERLINMLNHLPDNFELHLILTGDRQSSGFVSLQRRAAKSGRVFIHEPVSPTEIVQEINRYDIGVYILDPVNLNHQHALPNKFFEFIQARLATAIGPSTEMASIVRQHDLGVVADSFCEKALAAQLLKLDPADLQRFKNNSHAVASHYTAEHAAEMFTRETCKLLALDEPAVANTA